METFDLKNLRLEYAIKSPNGFFYNGNAYGNEKDFTDHPQYIFRYTERGAWRTKELFPAMFGDCSVVRLSN
jgi:hypothetical protein